MVRPALEFPALTLITGVMAAGKSTVAQALAEQFERGVHLRGDTFRRAIVSGRADMAPDPSPEALAQLRLRYRLAVAAAEIYAAAGFTTVLQDVAIGPALQEVIDLFTTRPVAVIVLAPSGAEIAAREAGRDKTGYHSFTPKELDHTLRTTTPEVGLWLDTTHLSVAKTVDTILTRAPREALV